MAESQRRWPVTGSVFPIDDLVGDAGSTAQRRPIQNGGTSSAHLKIAVTAASGAFVQRDRSGGSRVDRRVFKRGVRPHAGANPNSDTASHRRTDRDSSTRACRVGESGTHRRTDRRSGADRRTRSPSGSDFHSQADVYTDADTHRHTGCVKRF